MSPWELRALERGGWHNLRWNQLFWLQTDSSTGQQRKRLQQKRFVEVSGGYPGCAAVCCAEIFFDNQWQQRCYCDTWLWQKQKVYLVCDPCFGGLVQVDLHVFTQKGLHTKRAEHEGWHFSTSPIKIAGSLIASGWRHPQILITQRQLIAVGVAWQTSKWVKLDCQTG